MADLCHRGHGKELLIFILYTALTCICASGDDPKPELTHVEPKNGSLEGGTLLTLHGNGFAASQFSFGEGNENKGNEVYLFSPTLGKSIPCDVNKNGCTRKKIECFTRPMPKSTYYARVKVDGTQIPKDDTCQSFSPCSFKPLEEMTPQINKLIPQAGPPGSLVEMHGLIFSARYTTNQLEANATNNNTNIIQRVFLGPQKCEMLNPETSEPYLLRLDGELGELNTGKLKCKMLGSYVGHHNMSFIVGGPYGRSRLHPQLQRVSSLGKIHTFQTYAEITSISPSKGSVVGGTILTVTGRFFDKTDKPAKIIVGGLDCKITSLKDNEILCVTEAKPTEARELYPGNRGFTYEQWDGVNTTDENLDSISTMKKSGAGYSKRIVQDSTIGDKKLTTGRFSAFLAPPVDGDYSFSLRGFENARIHVSVDDTPQRNYSANTHVTKKDTEHNLKIERMHTGKINMKKGQSYHMEMLHSGDTNMTMGLWQFATGLKDGQTGFVFGENQDLVYSSKLQQEIQSLDLTNLPKSSGGTKEQQSITIKSKTEFRLGVGGVFTDMLTIDQESDDIEAALNDLPSVYPDKVNVKSSSVSGGVKYTIEFNSNKGEFPVVECMEKGSTKTTKGSVDKKGKAANKDIYLSYNGAVSDAIKKSPKANELANGVKSLLSAKCPPSFLKPSDKLYAEDFESKYSTTGNEEHVTEGIDMFCGNGALRTPRVLYKKSSYDPATYPWVCFAYLGSFKQFISVTFTSKLESSSTSRTLKVDMTDLSSTWNYGCWNIHEILKKEYPDDSAYKVSQVGVSKNGIYDVDTYVDTVYIGKKALDKGGNTGKVRRLAAPFSQDEVIVKEASKGVFDISITPRDCYSGIKKLELLNVDAKSYTVTQKQKASPGVSGSVDLEFNGHVLKNVPVAYKPYDSSTNKRIQEMLESIPNFGNVEVKYDQVTGPTCYAFKRAVTWRSATGDQPEIKVVNKKNLLGVDATMRVNTIVDGGVLHDVAHGDFFRTVHDKPQVSGYINGIPTACSGDCSFEWSDEATPTADSISPNTGSEGTDVTISGSGFDAKTISNNYVTIDGQVCAVQSATDSKVVCKVGKGSVGDHVVFISVLQKGAPRYKNGAFTFKYTAAITGINPSVGSIGGATTLTISGKGFSREALVKVGPFPCLKITDLKFDSLVCHTPPGAEVAAVDVTVEIAGQVIKSPKKFSYDDKNSPVVTKISTSSGKVDGSAVITISGNGFGTDGVLVHIAETPAAVTKFSDNEVVATLPSLPDGQYPLVVIVPNVGSADTSKNKIPKITYRYTITGISPTEGSVYGGTKVTLTGKGFSLTKASNVIKFGDVACVPESASTTQIVCRLAWSATRHVITNDGIHKDFGDGYAWDKDSIVVYVGDIVEWSWAAAPFTEGYGYRVEETVGATDTTAKKDGFTSGPTKTAKGKFEYKFVKAGTFTYWSGLVDPYERISMKGAVTVKDRTSYTEAMTLTISGIEPVYNMKGSSRRKRATSCSAIAAPLSGCDDTKPTSSEKSKFSFAFWTCLAPTVTSVSPNSGTIKDTITIKGVGFGPEQCQNEVMVGKTPCVVTSASTTTIKCSLKEGAEVQPGVAEKVSVNVLGRGYALMQITVDSQRSYSLLPHISSITPSKGSIKGETLVTISGGGFSRTAGAIGTNIKSACAMQDVKYDQIICKTTESSSGDKDIDITVGGMKAVCKGGCKYNYDSSSTPTVSGVTPKSIKATGNEVVMTGSGFGTDKTKVKTEIGGEACAITSIKNTEIKCNIANLPLGDNYVYLHVAGKGKASTNAKITGEATVNSMSPTTTVSTHGGILTIVGNGFTDGNTLVKLRTDVCEIKSISLGRIECVFPGRDKGTHPVFLTVGSTSYTTSSLVFLETETPSVTSISPTSGTTGDTVTIIGTKLGATANSNIVKLGDAECKVTSQSATKLVCTVGSHKAGMFNVSVHVNNVGFAGCDAQFTYALSADSVSPSSGSLGGGQEIVITGKGLAQDAQVTVCGKPCAVKEGATSKQLTCVTPSAAGRKDVSCAVGVTYGTAKAEKAGAYTYAAAKTAFVDDITPRRGGTGGGTKITIKGSNFGTDKSRLKLTIGGTDCLLKTLSDKEIVCETEPRKSPIKTAIKIDLAADGVATQDQAVFQYIDVWSSRFTWGGGPPPVENDFVIINTGQTMLLDMDTPILSMLLIRGGTLMFDEKDIKLNAKNILITHGGKLQIGTKEEPFQHKAYINMHGQIRAPELPIFGSKTLSVRKGSVELHGKPVETWTMLDGNVDAGSTTIKLTTPVSWSAGDVIVIASTGDHLSQKQNEKRTIKSIASDKKTITLTEALKYKHMGEEQKFPDGTVIQVRAEVGLLTRNIVFQGVSNGQWNDEIKACPEGFNPDVFATQTCFRGRFGEEEGSDEFGGQIMFSGQGMGTKEVVGHIEYVEFTYAGQAYRLGRYPIHFHINGDMSGTYVRGCALHKTFNRAINIHNSHNVLVEFNVVYDVMGGAIFLEDGIETGNIMQNNLVLFVKASTSLLNDDVTPSSFWVTHPNNTIRNNHAAGGTHFGFWYRFHKHPDGPSYTEDICVRKQVIQTDQFMNNTVHSMGWYGLWVFEVYHPSVSSGCEDMTPTAGVFGSITTWNCLRGSEWGEAVGLQFHNQIHANNLMAGIEGLFGTAFTRKVSRNINPIEYSETAHNVLKNNVIIARLNHKDHVTPTKKGLVLPLLNGLVIDGVTFINFDKPDSYAMGVVKISCICAKKCDGWTHKFKKVKWYNSPFKAKFEFDDQIELDDVDGTLSGNVGGRVVASSPLLPRDKCKEDKKGQDFSAATWAAARCTKDVNLIRYSFNEPTPSSLLFKNISVSNKYGSKLVPWVRRKSVYKRSWTVFLVSGEEHTIYFPDGGQLSNFSYNGKAFNLEKGNYAIIRHKLPQRNNFFQSRHGEKREELQAVPQYGKDQDGDWYWDEEKKEVVFLVSDNGTLADDGHMDREVHLAFLGCPTKDCKPPADPETSPPADKRPDDATLWSNASSWIGTEKGYGGNYGDGKYGPPKTANAVVKIKAGVWMVADVPILPMKTLEIYGVLELDDNKDKDGKWKNYEIKATYIFIRGGRLIVGWPNQPFRGQVDIVLTGNPKTPFYTTEAGPPMGSKAIGVFGGLDVHGADHAVTWTTLAKTASAGDTTLTLAVAVDWSAGDHVVITPSRYFINETETAVISAVSSDKKTITLTAKLSYIHTHFTETIPKNSKSYVIGTEVGILSRSVRIMSEQTSDLEGSEYGGRVLVATTASGEKGYTGYARLSNVEFVDMAQYGYTDAHDPRFSLAWVGTGPVTEIKPSYLKKCAFNRNFGTAVGLFGANGIPVDDNVIYSTVGEGLIAAGENYLIRRNLLVKLLSPGSYHGRFMDRYVLAPALIHTVGSTGLVLQGNTVAGSEQTGFHVDGEACDRAEDSPNKWHSNTAHATMNGLLIVSEDPCASEKCSLLSGFNIYRASHFGAYIQTTCNIQIKDSIIAETKVGLHQLFIGPDTRAFQYYKHTCLVKNSLIMGITPATDCSDKGYVPESDPNMQISWRSAAWYVDHDKHEGRVGIGFPMKQHKPNKYPEKPWIDTHYPPGTLGVLKVEDSTFAYFKKACGQTQSDVVFSSNLHYSNVNLPVEMNGTTTHEVPQEGKAAIGRAYVASIRHGLCVDMACDTTTKTVINDQDGGFLGVAGAMFSEAEWQWDGKSTYGIGDYRIPKVMLTDSDGDRIKVDDIAPKKGIIRKGTCKLHAVNHAWECAGPAYKMLKLESLDHDHMERRAGPVAILGDGFVDLSNGPADMGLCHGYPCNRRLSVYPMIVAMGETYQVYYTGTNSQKTRMWLMNSQKSEKIVVGTYYNFKQSMKVFVNKKLVKPKNFEMKNGKENYKTGNFQPTVKDPAGSNWFDTNNQMMWVVLGGEAPHEIHVYPAVMVSMALPAMSADDFFGANLVENLRQFLGLKRSQIKVMNVVRETSRRKRRAVSGIKITIEISMSYENGTDSDDIDEESLENIRSELESAKSKLSEAAQLNELASVLNTTVEGVKVTAPIPSDNSSDWTKALGEIKNGTVEVTIVRPDKLIVHAAPKADKEGNPLTSQPVVKLIDENGKIVENTVSSKGTPWEVTAVLKTNKADSRAVLHGTKTVSLDRGVAKFTDLTVSHSGDGYTIEFQVTGLSKSTPENLKVESTPFNVKQRALQSHVIPNANFHVVGRPFDIEVELIDSATRQRIKDIGWKGHQWMCSVSVEKPGSHNPTLSGKTVALFSNSSNTAVIRGLSVDISGKLILRVRVTSDPAEYSFVVYHFIKIFPSGYEIPVTTTMRDVRLKFDHDYDSIVKGKEDLFAATMYNVLKPDMMGVNLHTFKISKGSIIVNFKVTGSDDVIDTHLRKVHAKLQSGLIVQFYVDSLSCSSTMHVDGEQYAPPMQAEAGGVPIIPIVAGSVGGLVVIIIIIAVVVVISKKSNNRTGGKSHGSLYGVMDSRASTPASRPGSGFGHTKVGPLDR